jgi:hypothetical protein
MGVDAGVVIFAVDTGNVVKRVVLRDRYAEKAVVENVRPADRLTIVMQCRIRLLAIEIARLRRIRRGGGIGRCQIGIVRNAIGFCLAAEGIAMNREIAGAGIEQHRAIETIIDRGPGSAQLGAESALRDRGRNPVIAGLDDPPIACEPKRKVAGPRMTST